MQSLLALSENLALVDRGIPLFRSLCEEPVYLGSAIELERIISCNRQFKIA